MKELHFFSMEQIQIVMLLFGNWLLNEESQNKNHLLQSQPTSSSRTVAEQTRMTGETVRKALKKVKLRMILNEQYGFVKPYLI